MDPQQIPAESGPQQCTKHVAFHVSKVQKLSKHDLKHRVLEITTPWEKIKIRSFHKDMKLDSRLLQLLQLHSLRVVIDIDPSKVRSHFKVL